MASFTISSAVTTAGTAQLINTGDTITVTSSGSLDGTGTSGIGIKSEPLGGTAGGFDTVNISGTVRGGVYGFDDTGTGGHDSIQVMAGGSIFGGFNSTNTSGAAVFAAGGANTVTNAGHIADDFGGFGVELSGGGNSVTNSGTISTTGITAAAVSISGSTTTIANSGTISAAGDSAAAIFVGGDASTISNTGTVTGGWLGIIASGSSNTITNGGSVTAAGTTSNYTITMYGDANSVTNTGTILAHGTSSYSMGVAFSGKFIGNTIVGGNSDVLINSGTITALGASGYGTGVNAEHFGAVHGGKGDTIENTATGSITGNEFGIWLSSGSSAVVKNGGAISGGATGLFLDDVSNSLVKVLVGGSITGTTSDGIRSVGGGLHLDDKGVISGGDFGIRLQDSKNVVKIGGHGSVAGGEYGIYDQTGTSDHIFNDGSISSGLDGAIVIFAGGKAHIHNSGSVMSASNTGIYIYGGSDHVTNKGTISGMLSAVNIGFGNGAVAGDNVVTNLSSGLIKASATGTTDATLYFAYGGNTVTNSGSINMALHGHAGDAAIFAGGSGHNIITNNAGGLISDFHAFNTGAFAIELSGASNLVTNGGRIVGTVTLGTSGSNSYDGSAGVLKGTVIGGNGVDTITLGHGHSGVEGGGGGDVITAGAQGENFIYTGAGDSNITGFDTIDGADAAKDSFTFNLGGNALASLSAVTVNSLSGVTDGALSAAVAGHLDPHGAAVVSVASGLFSGDVFLIVDANGDANFDLAPGDDYLIVLTHLSGTLSAANIIAT